MKRLVLLAALLLLATSAGAPPAPARTAQCQGARVVLYTSNDWLALAQGLAADPSSCAQYYISIPPAAANKTQMRPDAASRVDALGSNFHALAEVNYTAWQNWVSSTGNSWYAAGQAARASMDAAGFNVAGGDTWAVNEFPEAVVTNSGGARQNVEQLLQGLDAGDGSDPVAQGVVFMVGVGQNGAALGAYKANLESWFQDPTFWSDMSADVSDFMFEGYGDVRDYAVAAEDPPTRMANLDAFLQAPLALVTAANAPGSAAAARAFLASAYGPLGNASWAWSDDYGWTAVDSATMADYVSAQTYAMRAYSADSRIGFAFNPANGENLAASVYQSDVAGILARLAGAIHETDGGDPEQACEATGCAAILSGAAPVTGWQSFSAWTPTTAVFSNPAQTSAPATPIGPLSVELETGGVPTTLPIASTVILSSSSSTGTFAPGPNGPWSATLTLTIPPGSSSATFYAQDSSPGSPTLTANLAGALTTQTETIQAPPPPAAPPPPPAVQVGSVSYAAEDDHMHVALRVSDAAGGAVQAQVGLALLVGSTTVATSSGATTASGQLALTAAPALQRGCYRVEITSLEASGYRWDGSSPTESDCVSSLPARIASLSISPHGDHLQVAVRVTDDAGTPLQARVGLSVVVGSSTVTTTSGLANAQGVLAVTPAAPLARGCYRVRVSSLSLPGFTWDGVVPASSDCISILPFRVGLVGLGRRDGHLHAELRVSDESGHPVEARVSFALLHGGAVYAATSGSTDSSGELGLTAGAPLALGCYRLAVQSVRAPGFRWDGVIPNAQTCVTSLPHPKHAAHPNRRG